MNKKKNSRRGFTSSSSKSKIWSIVKILLIVIFSAFILAFASAAAIFVYYAKDADKLNLKKLQAPPSTVLYDANGDVLATLGAEQRTLVETGDIPVMLVDAVTSIEDHRFFNTRGVDPIRIAGAFVNNAKGGSLNGGSTLDMQLIKLAYFGTDSEKQTLRVKVQEAWLALQLDQKWTKDEIFTAYVNRVNMNNGYYGMRTAAKAYYGKDLTELSIPQLALLAGIPQAPTTYDPYTHPKEAKWRRDMVINSMYKYEKITASQRKKALATPINDGLQELKPGVSIPKWADNYIKQVVEEVKSKTKLDAQTAGLKIYTTLDTKAQKQLNDVINTDNYVNYPDDKLQVATTLIDVKSGAVVAQMGARHQDPNVTFGSNQAVLNDRDWGSTMKPITDYAPAFEYGIYNSTNDYIADTGPYAYPDGAPLMDWDRSYMGNITVRQSLALSRNIPAVKSLISVGLDKSNGFLNKLGINYQQMQYSNAISSDNRENTLTDGATSEKMAAAYAAFSNGGIYTKPYYITKIIDSEGKETVFTPTRNRAMKTSTAYAITDILKSVLTSKGISGALPSGTLANTPGLPEAAKTGTSSYDDKIAEQVLNEVGNVGSISPDETIVGYSPQYSIAVWTGYDPRTTPIYGDKIYIAGSVMKAMMDYLHPDPTAVPDWEASSDVTVSGNLVTVHK